ncbi:hypothetical protein [Burkholderia sp. Ac-20365]|uniref:hypothetical protein n=1 Tax=Burkholderia sp. Ac-20365 TaxID=2703897 RepID=UPI00197B0793|nr:hypothetical protein [Burkholderia sp. Ac-20365]MBN3759421.1 hypothetical protein [Burkholderia sp. Ac-20365]
MRSTLSAPVQLVLAVTIAITIVSMLIPEPVEHPMSSGVATGEATPDRRPQDIAGQPDRPWSRPVLPEVELPKQADVLLAGTPPLPPPGAGPALDSTPPLPPLPAAQAESGVTYLGRMVQDGKVQVFLASGSGNPVVLHEGDLFDSTWRVESISPTDVALQNPQTGESRIVAMGGNLAAGSGGVASVQVGQRFLASHPLSENKERQQDE